MKKIILAFMLLVSSLFAELTNKYPSVQFLDSKTPIVDIRTEGEWIDTGILKGAVPITFFDERGNYDIPGFLKKLNEKVDTTKPFALICHTGNRASMLAPFLSQELHYNVINLQGGMDYVTRGLHVKTVPYKK